MEGVPRLYMLSFELKLSPNSVDFSTTLKKYIRSHYQENPDTYDKEIKDLETLRQSACKVSQDFTGCSVLKRYYSQLNLLQNRFPMTDDGPVCVPFTWSDIYSGATFSITDIKYEQACVLYNIGALHSSLGALDTRSNSEGMKLVCTHFQCAAWAFQHLRDTYPQPKGSDMAHDILTFMSNTMLAQAQECILEKSMLDNRKSSIISKVAAQVVDYYRCALGVLKSNSSSTSSVNDIVGSRLFKIWKKYVEFKMAYYASISHYYMGNQSEEQQKMGERVSWFQSAIEHLTEAIKISKAINRSDVNESLSFLTDIIGGKLSAAKKENDFVYHEKVLPVDSLPELKGASLVKGIPFNPADPDVCGHDIFARLVPMETHSFSSVYSEEKAKVFRSIMAKVEQKNEELQTFMSSLHLDHETFEDVPISQELMEKCAALSVRPTAIADLTELMKELVEISHKVEVVLQSCRNLLNEEEQKEAKHQEIFGKRVASMISVELKKECSKFEEAQKKAAESNTTLQSVASAYVDKLKILSGPITELKKNLPTVESVKSGSNTKNMKDYMKLLQKVEEMQEQRQALQDQLREAIQNDDITKRLMALEDKNDVQRVFHDELKKHDQSLAYINQNLVAQDNILYALTQANANFAEIRKSIIAVKKEREATMASFIASYEAYEDLIVKAKKGLEFFEKLKTNVSRLFDRIRSVTRVQEEEREQRTGAQRIKVDSVPVIPEAIPRFSASTASTVPKLKDYLPHMAARKVSPLAVVPQSVNFPMPATGSYGTPQVTPTPFTYSSASDISPAVLGSYADNSKLNTFQGVPPIQGDLKYETTVDYSKHQAVIPGKNVNVHIPSVPSETSNSYAHMNAQKGYYSNPPSSGYIFSTSSATPYVNSISQAPQNVPHASVNSIPNVGIPSTYGYQPNSSLSAIGTAAPNNVGSYQNQTVSASTNYPSSYFQSAAQIAYPGMNQSQKQPGIPQSELGVPSVGMNIQGVTPYSNVTPQVPIPNNSYPYGSSATNYMMPTTTLSSSLSQNAANHSSNMVSSYPCDPLSSQPMSTNATNYALTSNPPAMQPMPSNIANYSMTTGYSSLQPMSANAANYVMTSGPQNMATYSVTEGFSSAQPIPTNAANYSTSSGPNSMQQIPINSTNYSYAVDPAMSYVQTYSPAGTQGQFQPSDSFISQSTATNTVSGSRENGQTYQTTQGNGMTFDQHPNSFDQSPLCAAPEILPTKVAPNVVGLSATVGQSVMSSKDESQTQKEKQDSPSRETNSNPLGGSEPHKKSAASEIMEQLNSITLLKPKEVNSQLSPNDPLDDESTRAKFVLDVEKFEKHVEGLVRKSLNGTTPLDQKWKELNDVQEKESRKMSISVARCYPLKNRVPDIMPYDINRVKLTSSKDDYINASYLKDLLPSCPTCIITQSPLPSTYGDFWLMVWEQQVETVVCLMPLSELKTHVYWPKERNQTVVCGSLDLVLQGQKEAGSFTQRIINITNNKNKVSRVVVHLQFNYWPSSQLPVVSDLLKFVTEVLSFHKQQRSLSRPVVVHCSSGVGRSGLFCLLTALVTEVDSGHGPREVTNVAARMCQQRKYIIQDKDHLKFCYESVLCYAIKKLQKRGILVKKSSFGDVASSYSVPSKDDIQLGMATASLSNFQLLDSAPQPTNSVEAAPSPSVHQTPDSCLERSVSKDSSTEEAPSEVEQVGDQKNESQQSSSSELTLFNSNAVSDELMNVPKPVMTPVTAILDPLNFTLDAQDSPAKRRITKDMFLNQTRSLDCPGSDVSDPLSKLNPMWTLKK